MMIHTIHVKSCHPTTSSILFACGVHSARLSRSMQVRLRSQVRWYLAGWHASWTGDAHFIPWWLLQGRNVELRRIPSTQRRTQRWWRPSARRLDVAHCSQQQRGRIMSSRNILWCSLAEQELDESSSCRVTATITSD